MRIDIGLVTTPGKNTLYVAAATALSFLVFAYSTQFGQISILAFYAVWFLPLALAPRIALVRVQVAVVMMVLPALAILSTMWSDAAGTTLRSGIQLATTAVCAIVAARIAGTRGILLGGILGAAAVLAYSVAFGSYSYDVLDARYTFVGAFGSKNQLGLFASLGVVFGLVAAMSSRLPWWLRLGGAVSTVPAAVILAASASVTSWISLGAALAGGAGLAVMRRVRPVDRLPVVLVILAAGAVGVVIAMEADVFARLFAVFGKDPTLTGRTYLWSEGIAAVREEPFLGMGYNAFWRHGYLPAENLWEAFFIDSRSGFHFHSTYIETAVGLGLAGLGVLAALLVGLIAAMMRAAVTARLSARTVLSLILCALLLIRSMVEIDFLFPYTVGAFFIVFAAVTLIETHPAERYVPQPFRRPVRRAARAQMLAGGRAS